MRIAIVGPVKARFNLLSADTEGLGGIETACVELTRALAARGHAMTLVSRVEGVIENSGARNVGFSELGHLAGDAIIACGDPRTLERGDFASRVLWMHNPLALEKAVRRGLAPAMWRARPHAVFGSRDAERACSRLFPFASRHVAPLGVTSEFINVDVDQPRELRFVWVTQPQRGLGPAVAAWRKALPDLPQGSSFHIFGSRVDQAGLSATEAAANNVILHPRATKPALAAFLARSLALVCLGARDETFCLAAAEAQCAGVPTLTLGIGALSERVSHGVNGLVASDFERLRDDMVRIARDRELAAMLRQGALATGRSLSWPRSAKIWEGLLETFDKKRSR